MSLFNLSYFIFNILFSSLIRLTSLTSFSINSFEIIFFLFKINSILVNSGDDDIKINFNSSFFSSIFILFCSIKSLIKWSISSMFLFTFNNLY